jgi:hypothetical protein
MLSLTVDAADSNMHCYPSSVSLFNDHMKDENRNAHTEVSSIQNSNHNKEE